MKPHRLTLTHNLVFNYDLHKKMEVRAVCIIPHGVAYCVVAFLCKMGYLQLKGCLEKSPK